MTFFVGGVGTVCVLFVSLGEVGFWVLRESYGVRDFCEKYGQVGTPDS